MFQTFHGEWELIESMLLMSGPLIGSSFSSRCVLLHLTFELHQRSSLYTQPPPVLECNPESLEILQNSPLKWHERTFFDLGKRRWCVDEKVGGVGVEGRVATPPTWQMSLQKSEVQIKPFLHGCPPPPQCCARLLPSSSPLSSVMTIHQHYRNLSLSAPPVH